jgi:pimeloyl-ACP methyl ester carboxylesterase
VRRAGAVLSLLLACAGSGCASLADRIVEPPGDGLLRGLVVTLDEPAVGITRNTWQTAEGVTLAYRLVPAGKRSVVYRFKQGANGASMNFQWVNAAAAPLSTDGTVVYLSGWGESGDSMLPWAMLLAGHGYRGVAVDLRNTGNSSRAPMGFGPREAGDVAALIAHLRGDGTLQEPVFVFGVSYGAVTALLAEPALRQQLAGIIAMEPYANAADAIRTMVPGVLGRAARGVGGRLSMAWARHRYDSAAIERAIVDVNHRLHLNLAAIDLHGAVAQSRTCTLLLHGARDTWIPVASSRSLAQAAPQLHYTELAEENHMSLPLRMDWLEDPIVAWLGDAAAGRCVPLALPADPARMLPAEHAR